MLLFDFFYFFLILGVRELFEQEPPAPARKTRPELMREVDADYYGYRDDDDGVLIPLENAEEKIGKLCQIRKCIKVTLCGNTRQLVLMRKM